MKIVINGLAAVAGGSVTYLLNLLPALSRIDSPHQFVVLLPDALRDHFSRELPSTTDRLEYTYFHRRGLCRRLLWEQSILPLWLIRHGCDVLFAPMDVAPNFAPCPVVLAVRNPNPYYQMTISGNPKGKFFLQKMLTRLSSRKAKKVIFVSQYARNTIADQLGIPFEKSEVVYHGLNHELFSPDRRFETLSRAFREKIDALAPYVLCVSTLYPHKNYDTLLKAWAQLPDKIRHRYKLVIAGMCADFAHCEYLFNLTDHLSIADEVVFLGRVLYHNIPYLYAQASTFVLPSYLETFGHPLVEAMAMRVPIVASKSTCIPEIVADAAILFDASNSRELAKKLESVILDQQIRRSLVARGRQRASSFSWGQTARKTLRLIERVAER